MTTKYTPKVGDRVQVVYEGTIKQIDNRDDSFRIRADSITDEIWVFPKGGLVKEIKKVITVPTKPGAVVFPYDKSTHSVVALDEGGEWFAVGYDEPSSPSAVLKGLELGTHYVAFEGVEA